MRKQAVARMVVEAGLRSRSTPSCIGPISTSIEDMVAFAAELGARRIEIAHAQYYGWAMRNRAALMPTRAQVDARPRSGRAAARARLKGGWSSTASCPTTTRGFRSPAWAAGARRSLNVTPTGRALPCHAAETIPGLDFWQCAIMTSREIWARIAGLPGLPRHGLDAGALPVLRAAGDRFRRLPLPGPGPRRRRAGDRSRLRAVSVARRDGGARRSRGRT